MNMTKLSKKTQISISWIFKCPEKKLNLIQVSMKKIKSKINNPLVLIFSLKKTLKKTTIFINKNSTI
jgi:hypothetical protein